MIDPEQVAAPPIGHDVTVTGEVNAPVTVTLYDDDGLEMQVREQDANAWIAKGFKRERWDTHAKLTEFRLALDAAEQAVEAFVTESEQAGVLNTAANAQLHTAGMAMVDVNEVWSQLYTTICQKYPVVQAVEETPRVEG